MPFLEPVKEFVPRTRTRAAFGHEGRLVTPKGRRAESVVLVHPFGPTHMLKDLADRPLGAGWECGPVIVSKTAEIRKKRLARIGVKSLFTKQNQGFQFGSGVAGPRGCACLF